MTKAMQPLVIRAYTLTTALGVGVDENWQALKNESTGLKPCDFGVASELDTWIGEVDAIPSTDLPGKLKKFTCRNNNLANLALAQDDFDSHVRAIVAQYGEQKVGVFIGTSTSGIQQTELAYDELAKDDKLASESLPEWYDYQGSHNMFSPTGFICQKFGLKGPAHTISTACSSSAKVFASAQRAIDSGLIDAAIVGGVDTLCNTTLFGFNSLQVVAQDICRPSDKDRNGISIGEAAGFAILEKASEDTDIEFALCGYGESADAYHMSSPHPEGLGAKLSMQSALAKAGLSASQIGYVNLHGTGTPANDKSEGIAVHSVFGKSLPCSSTKGWTGHTLGAAGIVEAIFSIFVLKHQWLPKSLNTKNIDPDIPANINLNSMPASVDYVLSNSFGFGGSNCSLIIGKAS
ncbi:MAG: beta-ketoacyl-[acyl-carrier-protein] synthase family protein [Agarilytica sp.]